MDRARLAHRLWHSTSPAARVARAALLPAAALYRAGVAVRNAAFDLGVLPARGLPRPSLGVGNIAVGGVGKTPVAAYLARELARRGATPGILLRGYGGSGGPGEGRRGEDGDEAEEHRSGTPGAAVVAERDRRRGAARAVAAGADVLVLDDCLQHRAVRPDVLLAVLAAESAAGPRWPLPAGPWREGLGALARCDGVVVTHKTAPAAAAADAATRLAARTRAKLGVAVALEIGGLVPLTGGAPLPARWLEGRAVTALSGIGEPELFGAQLERLGATVHPLVFGDHHRYTAAEAAAIAARAGPDGAVVTTAKDAIRLRPVWPPGAPPCLVAELSVRVTHGQDDLARLLDRLGRAAPQDTPIAAHGPLDQRDTP